MAAVTAFGKLTSKQEDLFKKKYCYGSLAQAVILAKNGDFQWKAHGRQLSSGVKSSAGFEYTYNGTKFTVKKTAAPTFKGNFEFDAKNVVPGMKIKGELLADPAKGDQFRSGSGTVEYGSPEASAKLQITSDAVAKASFTTAKGIFGVGLDGAFDSGASRLTAYNAAFWLAFDQCTLCLKHESTDKKAYKLGKLVNSFHRKLKDGEIAGRVETDCQTMKTTMEFGGAFQPWKDAEFRGKFNSDGNLGLSWGQKLREGLSLTVASLIDTNKVSASGLSDYQFGFRFDFEP